MGHPVSVPSPGPPSAFLHQMLSFLFFSKPCFKFISVWELRLCTCLGKLLLPESSRVQVVCMFVRALRRVH